MYKHFSLNFLDYFHSLRHPLLDILLRVENYKTAVEEYKRAEKTLELVTQQRIPVNIRPINQYAAYLPYNNVLYSLVLYALVPSLIAKQVFIRPSHLSGMIAEEIYLLMKPYFPEIELKQWSRRDFLSTIVSTSNVVAFTGRYSSLPEVANLICDDQLLLYGGDGLVSFLVDKDADIEEAAEGAIRDRLYSSGQDCICPDIFLVHNLICRNL